MTDATARLRASLGDRYAIEGEIGRGGMAIVYRARDLRHDRTVAIKVLREEIGSAVGSERFLQEIRIESRLQHPNILPLHDSGVAEGMPYYVMPYVEGETLRDRLGREGPLPVQDVVRIAREVGEALFYAHTQGLVHRDVKPENILLSSGHAVVADFGIAQAVSEAGGERLTATGVVIGTPAYMSPEQAGGADTVDARSDVYSLGCVVYEMLVGEPPFGGRTAQAILARHVQERPPSIEIVRPDVPPHLIMAVERALAKTPADRPATAAEFVASLSREGRARDSPRARAGPRRAWGPAVAAALVAVLGFGAWLVFRPAALPPDANRIVVFPLLERGLGPAESGTGLDVAILIGTALDGTEPLRWIDGWSDLDPETRSDVGRLSAVAARDITLARGARYFVDGVVQATVDSMVVALRVYDAAGDSLLTRASARDARGAVPPYRLGLAATTRVLPVLLGSVPGLDPLPLLERSPAAVALFIQGERAYRKADFGPALEFYQRAVADDSLLLPAAMKGAQAAGWQHQTRDAEALIGFAVRHDSLLPPRHRLLARGLGSYFAGDADSALRWLRDAVAADSAWGQAHMALGEVAQHLLPRDQDSLPQLAEREFRTVLALDSAFAPALYLGQHAILAGDLDEAARLLERLRSGGPDPEYVSELEIAHLCLRLGAEAMPWHTVQPADAQRAAKLLSTAGAHLACAESGFRAVYHSPLARPSDRWGALLGVNGVLSAQGRWNELRTILDSAVAGGLTQGLLLYLLDTFAGAPFDAEAARAEAFARQLFGESYQGASSQTLWFLGAWYVHLGDTRKAATILDSMVTRAAAGGGQSRAALRDGIAGQVALARGDTAEAVRRLRAAAPATAQGTIEYDLTASLPLERLMAASLDVARGEFARAHRTAASFDGEPIVNLPFLPASLRLRLLAAERLQRPDLRERYRARIAGLGWPVMAMQ